MSGTRAGGLKAREKNLTKNPNFYKEIGSRGGSRGTTGGFASDVIGDDGLTGRQRASVAGYKGGVKSKRRSKKDSLQTVAAVYQTVPQPLPKRTFLQRIGIK